MKNKSEKKSLVVGITGSLGCGKTTCTEMLRRFGAVCIDADKIYHRLLKPQGVLYKKIISAFGEDVLTRNKKIDRKKLGKIAFRNRTVLNRLNRITHPAIIKTMKDKLSNLKESKRPKIIVIDAPLLIEAGLVEIVDKLIVVKLSKKRAINRVRKLGMPKYEIIQRIRNQAPEALKIKLADYVIDNNGSLKQTKKQVKNIWEAISCKP